MWVCTIIYLMERQFNKPRLGWKIIFVTKIIGQLVENFLCFVVDEMNANPVNYV